MPLAQRLAIGGGGGGEGRTVQAHELSDNLVLDGINNEIQDELQIKASS